MCYKQSRELNLADSATLSLELSFSEKWPLRINAEAKNLIYTPYSGK